MGIRLECPNGHRLNVKSHLAGKRGICPECQAKFTIPATTNGTSEAGESVVISASEPAEPIAPAVELPPSSDPPQPPAVDAIVPAPPAPAPPPIPPAVSSMPDVWYVRAASGEQFGPANSETFNGWAAAGRVPGDSLVWRTGWPQWKSGAETLAELKLPASPVVEDMAVSGLDEQLNAAPLPAENYRVKQRKRRERAKLLTLSLAAVVFLLLVILVVVLVRN